MESELCGIFWVKLVCKNIVRGSVGTQRSDVLAVGYLSLKKYVNVLNKIVSNPFKG